jgi:hypothetical protein
VPSLGAPGMTFFIFVREVSLLLATLDLRSSNINPRISG